MAANMNLLSVQGYKIEMQYNILFYISGYDVLYLIKIRV